MVSATVTRSDFYLRHDNKSGVTYFAPLALRTAGSVCSMR